MRITKTLGRYNLANTNERSWVVQMKLPNGEFLSESWPEDREPDIDGLCASAVVELIAERNKSYLFTTTRDKVSKMVSWCRENAEELDREWAATEIKKLQRTSANIFMEIESLRYYL